MSKINLNNVTLVCADDVNTAEAFVMMTKVCQKIKFADIKLFSSKKINNNVEQIKPLTSIKDYDNFIFKDLNKYIKTEFCMIVQIDGFPINYDAWNEDFLRYDYIGAPWLYENFPPSEMVGNSGFSMRSKRLMDEIIKYDYSYEENGPEDVFICREKGDELRENKIKFAPINLAQSFSVENMIYNMQFGFHGKTTRVMNQSIGVFGEHLY